MSTIDLIPAPADDTVVFRQHRWRVFATAAVLSAPVTSAHTSSMSA